MTSEEILGLAGKIACVDGGQPVVITKLTVGDGRKADTIAIRLAGLATATLVNKDDPTDGSEPLPEPVECGEEMNIEGGDKQIFYDKLTAHFGISPPLTDSEDEWLRFEPGAENSVYDNIVGGQAYFRLNPSASTNPKFAPTLFTNLVKLKSRAAIQPGDLKALKAKLDAQKKAKAEKDAAIFA